MNKEMKTSVVILDETIDKYMGGISAKLRKASNKNIEIEAMEIYAAQFKPPAISSNEGGTVEQAAENKFPPKLVMEAQIRPEYGHSHLDLNKEKREAFISGAQWQSQHSYTEADLKAAWQAGNDFGNECHCGECDYCIDVKYGEVKPFDVWVKKFSIKGYTEDKWIKVEDRLPENRTWVLVMSNNELFLANYKHGLFQENDNNRVYNVTHWQPLPSPPTK